MAMAPERSSSKSLQNFTMPTGLRWGKQRSLRCMKVNPSGEVSTVQSGPSSSSLSIAAVSDANPDNAALGSNDINTITGGKRKEREELKDPALPLSKRHRRGSDSRKPDIKFKLPPLPSMHPSASATESSRKYRSPETGGGQYGDGQGIAAVKEKIMFHLQTAADKMKDSVLRGGLETEDKKNPHSPAPAAAPTVPATVTVDASVRPWNLRPRTGRATYKAPTANGFDSGSAGGARPTREKKRVKFSVQLTAREIEEDFLAFDKRRPARRPKKRPKHVQNQLDTLFPGLWLREIRADMYKVPEMH